MSQHSATLDREGVMADVLNLLSGLASDWEYSGEIKPETYLFADLGFESIDAVVLASHVQEHYKRKFPFPEFLAELGRREVKDLTIGELVDFVWVHLAPGNTPEQS
jgi:acyl carrier protein